MMQKRTATSSKKFFRVIKMKVLQVNCVYNTGSTGKITAILHKDLTENDIKSVVCYGRGKKVNEPNVYKTCSETYAKFNNLLSRFTGIMYGGCLFSTDRLIKIIKKEKPDIVHLQCINGYFVNIYRLVNWLKNNNVKTVLTLHAEFMFTANCGHSFDCEGWKTGCGKCTKFKAETKSLLFDGTARSFKKMQKAFDGFKKENLIIVSVSPWLMERAKQSPILAGKQHTVVMNGLDTSVFYPREVGKLKSGLGITDEKIIFHVTPFFSDSPEHIKGGYYIIKLAEMLKGENVKIIVAGSHPENLKVPDNILLLGKVNDQNRLAELYSAADVTVIASKRETFSMVCAESLCCETPVAGFKAGGPETISIPQFCEFVDFGNVDLLYKAVDNFLNSTKENVAAAKTALQIYGNKKMVENYIGIYNSL